MISYKTVNAPLKTPIYETYKCKSSDASLCRHLNMCRRHTVSRTVILGSFFYSVMFYSRPVNRADRKQSAYQCCQRSEFLFELNSYRKYFQILFYNTNNFPWIREYFLEKSSMKCIWHYLKLVRNWLVEIPI